MQRLIRSFNTLTDALKETLQEQYPDGIDSTHIKTIPTAKGDILRVIELRTADALYLIKINPESRAEIEEFLDQEDAAPVGDDLEEGGGLDADDTGGDSDDDGGEDEAEDDGGEDDDPADDDGGADDDED
ncbi:MAG: hypothetical protein IPO05_04460 [Flavobacteriales bacterium]|jgi:hypothetical protein|nr:hypothetical protein [Flavobacteriales bacterium]MBK9512878.1 hypothetical protein [Flavobacteriales bacterium]MBP7448745.1 hypothetical protein [Flavobacteriales bacterium]HOZ41622.1 hypothetical protein [Flavobacteriales bacterium]